MLFKSHKPIFKKKFWWGKKLDGKVSVTEKKQSVEHLVNYYVNKQQVIVIYIGYKNSLLEREKFTNLQKKQKKTTTAKNIVPQFKNTKTFSVLSSTIHNIIKW